MNKSKQHNSTTTQHLKKLKKKCFKFVMPVKIFFIDSGKLR